MFPSTANKFQKVRKENPEYAVKQTKMIFKKSKKTTLKESTNEALNMTNESFEQTYGISFAESLSFNSNNLEKSAPVKIGGKLKNSIFGKQWKNWKWLWIHSDWQGLSC